jgi:hypothetical protein
MNCPHCTSFSTKEQRKKTALGYRTFCCLACKQIFHERTNTPFNYLEYPTDLVLLVVLWRLRYKLSLRDLAEMFLARGFVFTHETVRDWEARFAPLIADQLRAKRHGQAGTSWYVDLRHEVAYVAVETEPSGLNLMFYHQYPTGACEGSNPLVGSLRDNVPISQKGERSICNERLRLRAATRSRARVG